ncbi:Cell division control protein 24 [Nakaseomyces bracarensis]|uniref:Cell division control protein 24 n=1 Tax=Nakaseomyces bracarensis TaxID=273131 RepID=A0ABR4NM24_9SACH
MALGDKLKSNGNIFSNGNVSTSTLSSYGHSNSTTPLTPNFGSGPIANGTMMNRNVSEWNSLYYVCLAMKKRLEHLTQMQPYLNLAYSSSELLSERQALLLSQKQQLQQMHASGSGNGSGNNRNSNFSAHPRDSHDSTTIASMSHNNSRSSAISTSSYKDEMTMMDGITYTQSNRNTHGASSRDSSVHSMEDTLLTFSMGILPISMDCDPVTQLSQLFQQGSPLCVLFNAVKPQHKLAVVSSDDMKVCKKSIYDFILGCKNHFAFNDEELFTISDVFSNSTNNLMRVIEVVQTLMDSAPEIFPTQKVIQSQVLQEIDEQQQNLQLQIQQNKKYAEHYKVIKEFVATERKYVHDLEVLDKYREQLLESNLITSEELYMLFPNLGEAIDFQRRFLVSLEINALVEPAKQRIGALFMHSKYFFKLYEPWSIGQNAAIEFLIGTLEMVSDDDFIIKNKLELQSFLYKPVQRLCRYPLLLKELVHQSVNEKSMKELDTALDISKSIARSINENQRRTENHQVVKKLYGRVANWKGYRISKFGELLYFDKVFISTNNSTELEKEFEVYLFEKIIILFSEINTPVKKSSSASYILKKSKSGSTGSALSLNINNNNSSNNSTASFSAANTDSKLDLRGRIMIMNLNQINPIDARSLNITWESIKEQGNFLLKFKNEEIRDNWCACLQSLVRDLKSESFRSTNSNSSDHSSYASLTSPLAYRNPHDSITSLNSTHNKHVSDILRSSSKRRTSQMESEFKTINETYKSSIPDNSILIRIAFNNDYYTVLVEKQNNVDAVIHTIKRKLNTNGADILKIKYQDEDGDYVILESEDDWLVAKDMLDENNERILNVWTITN